VATFQAIEDELCEIFYSAFAKLKTFFPDITKNNVSWLAVNSIASPLSYRSRKSEITKKWVLINFVINLK